MTPALDAIVMRCLAKKPEHRIQEASQLSALFASCLDGDAPVALPAIKKERGPGLNIAIGIIIGLAAIGGLAYVIWTF